MRKIWKKITILLIQLFMFYIFPLFAGPTDIMGMVFLILVSTFILAIIFAIISKVVRILLKNISYSAKLIFSFITGKR